MNHLEVITVAKDEYDQLAQAAAERDRLAIIISKLNETIAQQDQLLNTPLVEDVDVAMSEGMIMLMGGGRKVCDLPGDEAATLRDGLTDMIFERMGSPIEEIEALPGGKVCYTCGTVTLEFDPPLEIHASPPQEVELSEVAMRHLSDGQAHALKVVLRSMQWLESGDYDAEVEGIQDAIYRINNALKHNGDIVMALGRSRGD